MKKRFFSVILAFILMLSTTCVVFAETDTTQYVCPYCGGLVYSSVKTYKLHTVQHWTCANCNVSFMRSSLGKWVLEDEGTVNLISTALDSTFVSNSSTTPQPVVSPDGSLSFIVYPTLNEVFIGTYTKVNDCTTGLGTASLLYSYKDNSKFYISSQQEYSFVAPCTGEYTFSSNGILRIYASSGSFTWYAEDPVKVAGSALAYLYSGRSFTAMTSCSGGYANKCIGTRPTSPKYLYDSLATYGYQAALSNMGLMVTVKPDTSMQVTNNFQYIDQSVTVNEGDTVYNYGDNYYSYDTNNNLTVYYVDSLADIGLQITVNADGTLSVVPSGDLPEPEPTATPEPTTSPAPIVTPGPGGDSGGDDDGGNSGGGLLDWLGTLLADVIGGAIKAFLELLVKAIWALVQVLLGFVLWIGSLLSSYIPFLPAAGIAALVTGMVFVIVITVIKFIRG